MEGSDELRCLFTGQIERQRSEYIVEIPDREIEIGGLSPDTTYRVALLSTQESATPTREGSGSEAPVTEGQTVDVEIEDVGEQGDGIARVGPGYIIFVPNTEIGDRPTVEITTVKANYAFAEVV